MISDATFDIVGMTNVELLYGITEKYIRKISQPTFFSVYNYTPTLAPLAPRANRAALRPEQFDYGEYFKETISANFEFIRLYHGIGQQLLTHFIHGFTGLRIG
jgi:hypothetical protein